MDQALLSIRNLRISFALDDRQFPAVDGVDLDIAPGEALGLVGESGCGKSVTAFSILDLLPAQGCTVEADQLRFDELDLRAAGFESMRRLRGREIGIVFQDALTSLDPVFKVGTQLGEALRAHHNLDELEVRRLSVSILDQVGIPDPEARLDDYPHQLSGGMRQRVMIAIALVNNPRLLIADEPTTALDVTIQAQILQLIKRSRVERGMAVLFITHDLGVIGAIADRVAVMYAGRIVEQGPTDQILKHPRHPYTRGLIASIPEIGERKQHLFAIPGRVPTLQEMETMKGCRFAPRCAHAFAPCGREQPALDELEPGHSCACYWAAGGGV